MGDLESSFPPLPTSIPPNSRQGESNLSSRSQCNWKELLLAQNEKSKKFPLAFIPPVSAEVSFSEEDLLEGQQEWNLSLVGHAIGKRPFYGSLLAAVKRKWRFKGSLELLSLEGDFFLFKFSCLEDYQAVWNDGPCFLNGRPFIFQRWTWDFRPTKDQVTEIPIWIKLPNFPLCCWNEKGFSKIGSMIGVPLAVDNLTASKARITFARLCVQITTSSTLPDSIPINMNGMKFNQPVIYDWKPTVCSKCNTFSHDDKSCLRSRVIKETVNRNSNRGRSRSRNRATDLPLVNNFSALAEQGEIIGEEPEMAEVDSTDRQTPNVLSTDLNQPPTLSPQLEDHFESTEKQSHFDNLTTDAHLDGEPLRQGAVTRSLANSPNSQLSKGKDKEKPPNSPIKTQSDGEGLKHNVSATPSNQKGKNKKGKKPVSSSSQ